MLPEIDRIPSDKSFLDPQMNLHLKIQLLKLTFYETNVSIYHNTCGYSFHTMCDIEQYDMLSCHRNWNFKGYIINRLARISDLKYRDYSWQKCKCLVLSCPSLRFHRKEMIISDQRCEIVQLNDWAWFSPSVRRKQPHTGKCIRRFGGIYAYCRSFKSVIESIPKCWHKSPCACRILKMVQFYSPLGIWHVFLYSFNTNIYHFRSMKYRQYA